MGEEKDLLSALILELRRGTLTISVLSQMAEPKYGYALVQSLEAKGVAIDPNTLYPLLRRLESQGLLESKWETGGAKPRKYYQRTPYGREIYGQLKDYWTHLSAGVERPAFSVDGLALMRSHLSEAGAHYTCLGQVEFKML